MPRRDDRLVQECGAGLVALRRGERLAFAAPPLLRSGPVDAADLDAASPRAAASRQPRSSTPPGSTTGPGWLGVLLRDAEAVLALTPTGPRSAT